MDIALRQQGWVGRRSRADLARITSYAAGGWLVLYSIAVYLGTLYPRFELFVSDVLYVVPVAAATVLSARVALRATPERRAFWVILALSNLLWLVGELTWGFYEVVLRRESPFPSVADVFYLTSYALVPGAIVMGFRGAMGKRAVRAVLDTSVVIVVLGFISYTVLIEPQFGWGWSLATATGISYPLLGVVILMTLVIFGYGAHSGIPGSVKLVGVAFAVSAITDTAYTYLVVLHDIVSSQWLNIGWQIEAVVLCVAAARVLGGEPDRVGTRTIARDLTLPVVLLGEAVTLGVMMWDAADGSVSPGAIAVATFTVAALVVRLLLTSRDKQGVALKLEASLAELESVAAERERFLDKVLESVEAERIRVAGELHDRPIQRLTALQYDVAAATLAIESGDHPAALSEMQEFERSLSAEIEGLRVLMTEIRPAALDESGLVGALRDHLADFQRRSGVEPRFSCTVLTRPDGSVETVLYRVTQEALINVMKHSRARSVDVALVEDESGVGLTIRDDGVGFAPVDARKRDNHFGLMSMQRRTEMAGGSFSLTSVPGSGTAIGIRFSKGDRA